MSHYYAAITVKGYTVYKLAQDEDGVYTCLLPVVGYEMAADISCWCVEAPCGAEYKTDLDDVSVKIVFF